MTSKLEVKKMKKPMSWQREMEGFKRWVHVMNFDKSSLKNTPKAAREMLNWMEQNGVDTIEGITGKKVAAFFKHLEQKISKRTGKVLSMATLRNYLTHINRFAKYIRQSGQGNIEVPVKYKAIPQSPAVVFTQKEIERLYDVTDDGMYGIRDRALLAVFYGCGIRRKEAVFMEVKDVLLDRNLLYIRQGKMYRERYVPMIGKVKRDLLMWIQIARPIMLVKEVHDYLFISRDGHPIGGTMMYERIKKLVRRAGLNDKAGVHTLRHSIATHLLQNGMKLKDIARFLGHQSIESTQIYTHVAERISLQ